MANDSLTVVDTKARVIGLSCLRVIGATYFALLTPGHLVATAYGLQKRLARI